MVLIRILILMFSEFEFANYEIFYIKRINAVNVIHSTYLCGMFTMRFAQRFKAYIIRPIFLRIKLSKYYLNKAPSYVIIQRKYPYLEILDLAQFQAIHADRCRKCNTNTTQLCYICTTNVLRLYFFTCISVFPMVSILKSKSGG